MPWRKIHHRKKIPAKIDVDFFGIVWESETMRLYAHSGDIAVCYPNKDLHSKSISECFVDIPVSRHF
jgi:hypothetical protein